MAIYQLSSQPATSSLKLKRRLLWWLAISAILAALCFYAEFGSTLQQTYPWIGKVAQVVGPLLAALTIIDAVLFFAVAHSVRTPNQLEFEVTPEGVCQRRSRGLFQSGLTSSAAEVFFPRDHITSFYRAPVGTLALRASSPRAALLIPENLIGVDALIQELRLMGIPESSEKISKGKPIAILALLGIPVAIGGYYLFVGDKPWQVAVGGAVYVLFMGWSSFRSANKPYARDNMPNAYVVSVFIVVLWLGVIGSRVWRVAHPHITQTAPCKISRSGNSD